MDGFKSRSWLCTRTLAASVPLVALATLWLWQSPGREAPVPDPAQTLARAGRRLSQFLPVQELTNLARQSDRLVGLLTPAERASLAKAGLQFRVDRPVDVDVAAPVHAPPFWLVDGRARFTRLGRPLQVGGSAWAVYRKRYSAGWVRLGVNGLDRRPRGHYVVFVRPVQGHQRPSLTGLDTERWHVETARDGTSAAFDLDRPIHDLPAELQGAVLLQPAHARRHDTLLARGRVWKTHVPSSRQADQVCVAFGPEPAHSLVWTWRTDASVRETHLRLAPAAAVGNAPARDTSSVLDGHAEPLHTPDLLNDPIILRHHVSAESLDADTPYAYSIGPTRDGPWTPWQVVRTAPAYPRSFRFLAMGDPQCGLEEWGKLLATACRQNPRAAFLLIAGDLVDRGNERSNWDHFFLRAAGVFDRLPVMPAVGNHEYLDQGPRLYRAFFVLPRNGPDRIDPDLVYRFEYGNVFIAVLDSTLAFSDPAEARTQAEWLDRELSRTRARWKIVMFHHPLYASHPKRESPALRAAWEPVIETHRVDLVLQGHDHAYLRTYPLRGGHPAATPEHGTTYVVSVSGTKYYDQRDRPETAVGITGLSTYQTIDVEVPENRLIYRAWDGAGHEVDRFTIERPGSRPQMAARAESESR